MKEQMIRIADNVKLVEGSPVVLQCWLEEGQEWIEKVYSDVLTKRGFLVKSVILNSKSIIQKIENDSFCPEELYGNDWMDVKNMIDIYEFSPTGLVQEFEGQILEAFKQFMRQIFENFTKENKLFLQIRIPSTENAMDSGLELDDYGQKWSELVLTDYHQLDVSAEEIISDFIDVYEFNLVTRDNIGKKHDLKLTIEGRQWHKDTGNGDFPAGEVYIAPVETSVSGSFVASMVNWEGRCYEEVILKFKNGKLVDSSESVILEDLTGAPGDSLIIGEFGLGINPQLDEMTGYSLFDEKIKGTCHIAIGANDMFGGNNQSPVHIDFVAKSFDLEILR